MSRPRSARGNAPAARGGSARAARPGVYVQAPKSDIYVVMLSIALGAMVIGSILMTIILSQYDFKTKVSALAPAASVAV